MIPEHLRQVIRKLPDTRFYLSGIGLNLADDEVVNFLRGEGVKLVFCLYPATGRREESARQDMLDFYKKYNIDPIFFPKLANVGIRASPLLRNPSDLRAYESFLREAKATNGNIVIQCISGKHASGAYAMYYLAKNSKLNLQQAKNIFFQAGLSGDDALRIEDFLGSAGVNIRKIFEKKQIRLVQKAKETLRRLMKRGKHKMPQIRNKSI